MSFYQLTSPLILDRDPIDPMEAATKQYVDNIFENLDAGNFTSGTIPYSLIPNLTGVVSYTTGNNSISLTNSGVAAGTYPAIKVENGRVTEGRALQASDVPNVSWAKITSGKPTTIAGYGITDAIGLTGGTITGNITLTASPSDDLHMVTKGYVDSLLVGQSGGIKTGDIIRTTSSTTPEGFLKCNGGLVNKTTYNNLYSILNGNIPVIYPGNGKPNNIQIGLNNIIDENVILPITPPSTFVGSPSAVISNSFFIRIGNLLHHFYPSNNISAAGPQPESVKNVIYKLDINTNGTITSRPAGDSSTVNISSYTQLNRNLGYIIYNNFFYITDTSTSNIVKFSIDSVSGINSPTVYMSFSDLSNFTLSIYNNILDPNSIYTNKSVTSGSFKVQLIFCINNYMYILSSAEYSYYYNSANNKRMITPLLRINMDIGVSSLEFIDDLPNLNIYYSGTYTTPNLNAFTKDGYLFLFNTDLSRINTKISSSNDYYVTYNRFKLDQNGNIIIDSIVYKNFVIHTTLTPNSNNFIGSFCEFYINDNILLLGISYGSGSGSSGLNVPSKSEIKRLKIINHEIVPYSTLDNVVQGNYYGLNNEVIDGIVGGYILYKIPVSSRMDFNGNYYEMNYWYTNKITYYKLTGYTDDVSSVINNSFVLGPNVNFRLPDIDLDKSYSEKNIYYYIKY